MPSSGCAEIRTARAENEVLRREVERLRFEVGRHREDAAENERLRRLLDMRDQLAPRSVGASVVSANLSGSIRMIVLDRGTEDGVRADMAVVAWGGAVGRVVSADRRVSKVRLLSDPNGGAAGLVQRSRAQGMVVGRGDAPMAMLYVPAYDDVVPGDRVVTSGKDGVFPRGFTVGTRDLRREGPGREQDASPCEPEVEFARLEEVLVILDAAERGPALAGPEGAVSVLGGVLGLVLALMAQAALGRWLPQAQRFVDVLLWPVVVVRRGALPAIGPARRVRRGPARGRVVPDRRLRDPRVQQDARGVRRRRARSALRPQPRMGDDSSGAACSSWRTGSSNPASCSSWIWR